MPRIRFSFLPTFFTLLTVAFVVAAAVRIHSYSAGGADLVFRKNAATPLQPSARPASSTQGNIGDASVGSSGEEGTIVSADTVADQRRIAERERRYNELLATQPPAAMTQPHPQPPVVQPAVVKAAPPPPSLLSRIGSAISKAIGGANSSGPMTSGSPNGPTQHPTDNSGGSKDKEANKDPNSDTTPPTLGTIEFSPPLVQDGEETTLAITATDDISGVRTISGNVVSPSGALQGFAMQREGESPRFVARLMVPKDAAEGVWHINYLNLTDNASNSVTLSYNQGMLPSTAAFRVQSSRSDSTPPALKAVWLDRQQMKAGDHDTIFVTAEDDKSGVNLVSGVFISPSKFARVGFGCRAQENSTTWTCDLTPPANADCGDWQLEQIQLQDKANNMTAVRGDNPLVSNIKLAIMSDGCDSHPPVVQQVILDQTRVGSPGIVNIAINATDDNSGVASISGHFVYTGPVAPGHQPPRLYFSCRAIGEPPATTWTGAVAIPAKAARGTWKLGALQVLDKANNLKLYSANDPATANVAFTVQ